MKKLMFVMLPLLLAACMDAKTAKVKAVCYGPNAVVKDLGKNKVRVVVPHTGEFVTLTYKRMFMHGTSVCFDGSVPAKK